MEEITVFSKKSHHKIKAKLTLVIFKEDKNWIAFAPSLDVSGYGRTENEARKSFEISVSETFSYCYQNNTLASLLESLGWIKNKISPGIYKTPSIASKINTNSYLQEVINGKDQLKLENNYELSFA